MTKLKKDEVIDDLQLNGLKIIQNNKDFKFGIDAVLLSNFSKIKKNSTVIDFGTGTGIIPILLSQKTNAKKIIGIDIQPKMIDMAKRSVTMNKLSDKIEMFLVDINNAVASFGSNFADAITCNPPYFEFGRAIKSTDSGRAISRHEIKITFEEIAYQSSKILKPYGNFYLVHRPCRLVDVLLSLKKYNLEPKEIKFISPNINKPPNLFLLKATKGGKSELKFLKSLYVYTLDGDYTKEIYDIYNSEKIDVFGKED